MKTYRGKFVDGGDDFILFIITLLSVSNYRINSCSLQKAGKISKIIMKKIKNY